MPDSDVSLGAPMYWQVLFNSYVVAPHAVPIAIFSLEISGGASSFTLAWNALPDGARQATELHRLSDEPTLEVAVTEITEDLVSVLVSGPGLCTDLAMREQFLHVATLMHYSAQVVSSGVSDETQTVLHGDLDLWPSDFSDELLDAFHDGHEMQERLMQRHRRLPFFGARLPTRVLS